MGFSPQYILLSYYLCACFRSSLCKRGRARALVFVRHSFDIYWASVFLHSDRLVLYFVISIFRLPFPHNQLIHIPERADTHAIRWNVCGNGHNTLTLARIHDPACFNFLNKSTHIHFRFRAVDWVVFFSSHFLHFFVFAPHFQLFFIAVVCCSLFLLSKTTLLSYDIIFAFCVVQAAWFMFVGIAILPNGWNQTSNTKNRGTVNFYSTCSDGGMQQMEGKASGLMMKNLHP